MSKVLQVAVINNPVRYQAKRNTSASGSGICFCGVPGRLHAPVLEVNITRADVPGVQVENLQFRFITMRKSISLYNGKFRGV